MKILILISIIGLSSVSYAGSRYMKESVNGRITLFDGSKSDAEREFEHKARSQEILDNKVMLIEKLTNECGGTIDITNASAAAGITEDRSGQFAIINVEGMCRD